MPNTAARWSGSGPADRASSSWRSVRICSIVAVRPVKCFLTQGRLLGVASAGGAPGNQQVRIGGARPSSSPVYQVAEHDGAGDRVEWPGVAARRHPHRQEGRNARARRPRTVEPRAAPPRPAGRNHTAHHPETDIREDTEHEHRTTPGRPKHLKSVVLSPGRHRLIGPHRRLQPPPDQSGERA
jgi:hypothetical protein